MRYAILLAALLALQCACAGGGEPEATPSPSPAVTRPSRTREPTAEATPAPSVIATPAVRAETGGFDGFRAFASEIRAALAARDVDFFIGRARITEVTCAGEAELGPRAGKPQGTVLRGIPGSVSESDASAIFPVEEYEQSLQRYFGAARDDLSDEYGSGSLALYALAHKEREGEVVFFAIATSIVDIYPTGFPIGSSQREAHAFNFSFQGGRWQFSGETVAVMSGTSVQWLSGESASYYDQWQRREASQ